MAIESTIGGDGVLFVGEDKRFLLSLLDHDNRSIAINFSTWTTVFDVRKKDNSPTALINIVPSYTGLFDADPEQNELRAVVPVTHELMLLFKAGIYRWSWARTDTGLKTILGFGPFGPQKATAL